MQKKIHLIGQKSLTKPSLLVKPHDIKKALLMAKEMLSIMQEQNGVGLAAPQIGINKRIITFGFKESLRYRNEKSIPFQVLINPEYKVIGNDLVEGWEGCLSIPGIRGLVRRFKKIEYTGIDENGFLIKKIADGFLSRIIQHEIDHLNGTLFLSRIHDTSHLIHESLIETVDI